MAKEDLLLTCLIDAMEHQKVATVDIPVSFMKSDMEGETVHIKLEGKMAELLTKLGPNIYSEICDEQKGRTVLYVDLLTKLGPNIYRKYVTNRKGERSFMWS